jgi:L-asparaginase
MQYDDRVLGGSGATNFARKMVLNHFLQKFHNVVQNMKKIKIVWYWNSRLRCFDQNGKIAAAHPR